MLRSLFALSRNIKLLWLGQFISIAGDFFFQVGGIFYAAAAPCFIGALFLVLLYFARPVMEADAVPTVAPAE